MGADSRAGTVGSIISLSGMKQFEICFVKTIMATHLVIFIDMRLVNGEMLMYLVNGQWQGPRGVVLLQIAESVSHDR